MKRQWKKAPPKVRSFGPIIAFLGLTAIVVFPAIVHPMINPQRYKEQQEIGRAGINQEDIQPGNMRIWRDPFDRK